MNHRFILLATVVLMTGIAGCTGPTGTYNSSAMFGDVSGTRIAPPGTGTVQYPQQVANLPDPYYGNRATQAQPGWRPAGTPNTTSPVTYNPQLQNNQGAPQNTIPSKNLVVSTNTSGIQPRTAAPSVTPPAGTASSLVAGGMPLNDATRVATTPGSNIGIFNRTWEYVARPSAPSYAASPYQYTTQPVYANGATIASSSTTPGFAGPRPSSYANQNGYPGYQYGYPGYQNVNPASSSIAEGWHQREVSR